jgi:histidinol-phosphate aminotransferase
MNRFERLAAPGVRKLQPYQPGKPIEELEREYGVSDVVKLASNENPLGPSPKALAAMHLRAADLARYPDGNGFELKHALSGHLDVGMDQITLGNGSNDVLELVARAFATPGDEVVFSEHAFAVYPIVTQAIGAKPVAAKAKDWGHDLEAMAAAVTERTRLVFIANPNNPTGTWVDGEALERFVAGVPEHVIVVVDEAYFEFAADPEAGVEGYPDTLHWLGRYPNLIVTRTFSKAYGLAGLRVGYAVSHPEVADLLNRVRQPFNANSAALAAAAAALADTEHLARGLRLNREEMARLTDAFERMGLAWIPSVGTFVAVEVGQPGAEVYEALLREGVIVRPVGAYGMPNHLRVSVGLPEENQRFIDALGKALA